MGGTLLQKQGDEWVVIGYHSKRLPKSAKNFGVTELELTGLLVNIHGFMQLLCNRYFEVLVDHKAIEYMIKSKTESPTTRLKTLLLKLSEYTIDLKYQKGSEMHTSDALSRQNAIEKGQEGTGKGKPPYKKATKDIQIKKLCKRGTEATNAKKGKADTLLGDPVANTTTGIEKAKEKGQKDKIGIDDIGIFEFIFKSLPEPPELEAVDEDRLKELQNAIQEQLRKRDEERERNITKRVQEFKKTFDFVNSHLLKGVATMAELMKSDGKD